MSAPAAKRKRTNSNVEELEIESKRAYTEALEMVASEKTTKEAIRRFEELAEKLDGRDMRVLKHLRFLCLKNVAEACARIGEYCQAKIYAVEALKLDRSDVAVWLCKADVCIMRREYAEAIGALRGGLDVNPRHQVCLLKLIEWLFRMDYFQECVDACNYCVKFGLIVAFATLMLAEALRKLDKMEDAESIMRNVSVDQSWVDRVANIVRDGSVNVLSEDTDMEAKRPQIEKVTIRPEGYTWEDTAAETISALKKTRTAYTLVDVDDSNLGDSAILFSSSQSQPEDSGKSTRKRTYEAFHSLRDKIMNPWEEEEQSNLSGSSQVFPMESPEVRNFLKDAKDREHTVCSFASSVLRDIFNRSLLMWRLPLRKKVVDLFRELRKKKFFVLQPQEYFLSLAEVCCDYAATTPGVDNSEYVGEAKQIAMLFAAHFPSMTDRQFIRLTWLRAHLAILSEEYGAAIEHLQTLVVCVDENSTVSVRHCMINNVISPESIQKELTIITGFTGTTDKASMAEKNARFLIDTFSSCVDDKHASERLFKLIILENSHAVCGELMNCLVMSSEILGEYIKDSTFTLEDIANPVKSLAERLKAVCKAKMSIREELLNVLKRRIVTLLRMLETNYIERNKKSLCAVVVNNLWLSFYRLSKLSPEWTNDKALELLDVCHDVLDKNKMCEVDGTCHVATKLLKKIPPKGYLVHRAATKTQVKENLARESKIEPKAWKVIARKCLECCFDGKLKHHDPGHKTNVPKSAEFMQQVLFILSYMEDDRLMRQMLFYDDSVKLFKDMIVSEKDVEGFWATVDHGEIAPPEKRDELTTLKNFIVPWVFTHFGELMLKHKAFRCQVVDSDRLFISAIKHNETAETWIDLGLATKEKIAHIIEGGQNVDVMPYFQRASFCFSRGLHLWELYGDDVDENYVKMEMFALHYWMYKRVPDGMREECKRVIGEIQRYFELKECRADIHFNIAHVLLNTADGLKSDLVTALSHILQALRLVDLSPRGKSTFVVESFTLLAQILVDLSSCEFETDKDAVAQKLTELRALEVAANFAQESKPVEVVDIKGSLRKEAMRIVEHILLNDHPIFYPALTIYADIVEDKKLALEKITLIINPEKKRMFSYTRRPSMTFETTVMPPNFTRDEQVALMTAYVDLTGKVKNIPLLSSVYERLQTSEVFKKLVPMCCNILSDCVQNPETVQRLTPEAILKAIYVLCKHNPQSVNFQQLLTDEYTRQTTETKTYDEVMAVLKPKFDPPPQKKASK